ncbi:hypothetical protein NPIL_534161 [Nephila pilipes]|uniref:Uncharacterized protein n=1 Tax=Nephila pilipes TaxID=299642 RepID=A0A8X6PAH9_NEPPI|nr:hypothetical protein NPIL_534161 [Nephila pilipes]
MWPTKTHSMDGAMCEEHDAGEKGRRDVAWEQSGTDLESLNGILDLEDRRFQLQQMWATSWSGCLSNVRRRGNASTTR